MKKEIICILCVAFFYIVSYGNKNKFIYNKKKSTINLFNQLQNPSKKYLLAFATGNKKYLKRKEVKVFKELGLSHLFAPSGLHLTTLSILFTPFSLFGNTGVFIQKLVLLVIFITLGLYSTIPSLKRMAILKIFLFLPTKNINLLTKVSIFFFLDYLLGTFHLSPISYAFSLLFVITLVVFPKNWTLFYRLFYVQALTSYILGQKSIYLFILIINPVITFLFSIIFPLSIGLFYFFPLFINNLISKYINSVNFLYLITVNLPKIELDPLFLLLIYPKKKNIFTLIIIFLFPISLNNYNILNLLQKSPKIWKNQIPIVEKKLYKRSSHLIINN